MGFPTGKGPGMKGETRSWKELKHPPGQKTGSGKDITKESLGEENISHLSNRRLSGMVFPVFNVKFVHFSVESISVYPQKLSRRRFHVV